nr:transmembrane protease serine 3-like [Lepeophtheirus salmonis]
MDPLEWVAFAGPSNGQTDQSKTQINIVKRIVSNPSVRFQKGYYTDDLALIELNDPLIFNDHVQATCLEKFSLEDNICFVAGWADVNKEGVSFIQYLDRIPLPMISQKECNSQSHYNKLLNGNSLCTSSKHQNILCRVSLIAFKYSQGCEICNLLSFLDGQWSATFVLPG